MTNTLKSFWKKNMPRIIGFGLNILAYVSPSTAGNILLKAIAKPRSGKILSYQQKFLEGSKLEMLQLEGNKIATYHWQGKGLKILMAHGWESNAWRWRKLIKVLKQDGHYLIGLDGPAHGQSGSELATTPLYASFIRKAIQEYQPEVLIGHSFGGYSSLYGLSHYGNPGIKRLIILASPDRWLDIAAAFLKAIGANKKLRRGLDMAFQKVYDKPQSYFNASDFASNVEVAGLLIHDANDDINLVTDGRSIAAKWKNCTYIETNGLGHGLQSPEVFEKILQYLREQDL